MKELTEEQKIASLQVVMYGQLLLESYDKIKDTVLYSKLAKKHGTTFITQLNKNNKHVDGVYKEDPVIWSNNTREVEEFVSRIAKRSVFDIVMMNQIYNHYSKNKEDWDNLMMFEFKELNK